jgi:hypothetical protein
MSFFFILLSFIAKKNPFRGIDPLIKRSISTEGIKKIFFSEGAQKFAQKRR